MIDLTVKTLDSQNHAFSLADDITVREFKEHIAETVNVSADSQRLIYCGRVLQDEKHLSEYDVNGKVIHLVERAPPQSTQRGNSGGSQSQNQSHWQSEQPRRFQARPQFNGNPMYLGSISIPAEVVDSHVDWPTPRLNSSVSSVRIGIARRMLTRANHLLSCLENANAPPGNNSASNDPDPQESDEFLTVNELAINPGVMLNEHGINRLQEILGDLTPLNETRQVNEIATIIARSARAAFVHPMRSNDPSTSEPSVSAAESTGDSQSSSQEQQSARQGNTSENSSPNSRTTLGSVVVPLRMRMVQLLGSLMDTQERLRPFLLRYQELLELDPVIPGGRTASGEDIGTVEENQRFFNTVSECLHYLAHANHALSDIIIDVSQQPPRNLYCRPMVVQRSAILQAGIPIQVEAHISVDRNEGNNTESNEENSEPASRPPPSATATSSASQNPVNVTISTDQEPSAPSDQPDQRNPQVEATLDAILNLADNMEVLMEMGSPDGTGISVNGVSATIGTEPPQNPTSNNNNDNNNAPGTSRVTGMFPWGPVPSPRALRNLMYVFAGYMAQRVATASTTSTTTTPTSTTNSCVRDRGMATGVGSSAAPNPGQSTQARSNVGTHPTTSTQTRSTSRPHVFHSSTHPLGLGVGMGSNFHFDQLLPCNSHHIRRPRSATPNNSAATSSPQQPSQPSQVNTPSENLQTRSDGPPVASQSAASSNTGRSSSIGLREEIENLQRNGAESGSTVTFEELLLARGINLTCSDESSNSSLLQRLFSILARIELSEWHSLLTTGKFSRAETSRRLRSLLTSWVLTYSLDGEQRFIDELTTEISSYLERFSLIDNQPINVFQGKILTDLDNIIDAYIPILVRSILTKEPTDEEWLSTNMMKTLRDFASNLHLQFVGRMTRKPRQLQDFVRRLTRAAMNGQNEELREFVLGSVLEWIFEHLRPSLNLVDSNVYSDNEFFATNENTIDPKVEETQLQSAPEPMETEEASGNRPTNDPLDIDDGQEIPTTFPGHEQILPDWVPIIARDGVRQRRQLQLESGGVTTLSDAYLDGLPSKRRRLVEQQKPRLLVSPRPNHASIPASMERLVRMSVVRAGVEEADGAAAAVAADPAVRRAFGQAIRECLNPRRLQTPDFPDARRFPNATSFFTDKESPPKQ